MIPQLSAALQMFLISQPVLTLSEQTTASLDKRGVCVSAF